MRTLLKSHCNFMIMAISMIMKLGMEMHLHSMLNLKWHQLIDPYLM